MPKLSVAIITGGRSSERDISLVTASVVRENLDLEKYGVSMVDSADATALLRLAEAQPDIALIAQHGKGGEDGAIQGFLESIGIRYTGSGILASALALDKSRYKQFMQAHGIPMAAGFTLHSDGTGGGKAALPLIVKPNSSGSSDGLTVLPEGSTPAQFDAARELAFQFDDTILVEQFITGVEITGAVLGNDEETLELLPLVEIIPAKGIFDREAKYTLGACEEICPARLPEDVARRARELAGRCHLLLGCRGVSRTDMMVDAAGEIYVLETNTVPGMTPTSLLPRAAQAAGYEFPVMLDKLIEFALMENASK